MLLTFSILLRVHSIHHFNLVPAQQYNYMFYYFLKTNVHLLNLYQIFRVTYKTASLQIIYTIIYDEEYYTGKRYI